MEVIKQCRDCAYYVPRDFKCNLVTGYAHMPKDYCLRKGHVIGVPSCKNCKYSSLKDAIYTCKITSMNVNPNDFCSRGKYNE